MTTELSVSNIEQKIYFIRGRHVMLDSDLAHLYGVKTKVLNQAVRRNQMRFPSEDFMFQLREDEYDSLRSQNVTLENLKIPLKSDSSLLEDSLRSQNVTLELGKGKHRKFLPTVYTEVGAIILSGILNSDRAIKINIAVATAFVQFRRKFNTRPSYEERFGQLEKKIDQIDQISRTILQAIQQPKSGLNLVPAPPSSGYQTNRKKPENATSAKTMNQLVEKIQKETAHHYGIKVQAFETETRLRAITLPRQIAIYLIRKHTQLSFKDIGRIFGGKDHSTILHAFQKIESSINQDKTIHDAVINIESCLRL